MPEYNNWQGFDEFFTCCYFLKLKVDKTWQLQERLMLKDKHVSYSSLEILPDEQKATQ